MQTVNLLIKNRFERLTGVIIEKRFKWYLFLPFIKLIESIAKYKSKNVKKVSIENISLVLFPRTLTDPNMQLLCQLQSNDCDFNRTSDTFNGKIAYEVSSKSNVSKLKSTSLMTMLRNKISNVQIKKHECNQNISIIGLDTKQQVQQQQFEQFSRSNSINYPNNMQMDRNRGFQQTVPDNKERKMDDIVCRCSWSDVVSVPYQLNHSKLVCSKHNVKLSHRIVNHNTVANAMPKQKCNFFSTKAASETARTTQAYDGGKGCDYSKSFGNSSKNQQQNASTKQLMCGNDVSLQHKTSLKHVNRSPLIIVHRSNQLQIFIKYLLILNCFVCVASGNLMSRNAGHNDLSNKHNQTNVETATTPLNGATPLINNSRSKPILTTPSPILHSIMSNNRSQLHGVDMQSQENGRPLQVKHFAQQHLTPDAMPPAHFAGDSTNSYQIPNNDDNSEEFSRCASCQFREQLKAQNLASIKMHILARLSMTHPPNVTERPKISETILDNFYLNNGFRYIRVRNGSNEFIDDGINEMQGDDPNASSNNKHQYHHMHEYQGNGGIKSGLHEQHHHHQSSYHSHNRHSRYLLITIYHSLNCKLGNIKFFLLFSLTVHFDHASLFISNNK